jgi:fructokinase
MHATLALGLDLGGTKMEAVVVTRAAGHAIDVVERRRVCTERDRGYDAVLETACELIGATARSAGADPREIPIGVGMPGSITRQGGLVKNSNTVCLNGRPFREDLSAKVGRPILFENDANCFALAEARLGAGRAYADGIVFGVIMGSGVGGGVVAFGKPWGGPQGIAGEWGHHAVGPREGALGPRPRCYCGGQGCLELYLSGVAVEAEYERRSGSRRRLADIAALRDRDPHARAAIDEMLEAFGRGLANVIDILDPSAVVLGGGVSNLDLFYTEGVERVKRHVFNDELTTPVLRHELGDSAGVLGAALLGDPL